jgi:hypothetical protein
MSFKRQIVTKHRIYELAPNAQGVPIEDYFPGVTWPEPFTGAKVYDTGDGPVIAMPSKWRRRALAKPTP